MRDTKILFFDPMREVSPSQEPPEIPLTNDVEESQLDCLLQLMLTHSQDPIGELSGYLITEDPTYLPNHPETKSLIRHLGRDQLLRMMISRLLNSNSNHPNDTKGES